MASTGAQKQCCGKFAQGIPGTDQYGNCFAKCCKTCPPDCCDTALVYFQCGDTTDPDCFKSSSGVTFAPSVIESPAYSAQSYLDFLAQRYGRGVVKTQAPKPTYEIMGEHLGNLPEFSNEPIYENGFMQALEHGNCSIPCIAVQVTVTTSFCCFIISGNSITTVGRGSVNAVADKSTLDKCGNIAVKINGVDPPVTLDDNQGVSISLVLSGGDCKSCDCQKTKTEDPCKDLYRVGIVAGVRKTAAGLVWQIDPQGMLRRKKLAQEQQVRKLINKIRRSRRD